jgi:hypothetical protein
VVLSDAHPIFVMIQGHAFFPHAGGFVFVRNRVHIHGTCLRAFQQSGLDVLECAEAPMHADFSKGSSHQAPAEAAAGLWNNVPVALVWSLTRRQRFVSSSAQSNARLTALRPIEHACL